VHRIKDEYIGYFFTANSSYIEKTEDFQKVVIRMIKNRKFEELIRLADSENLEKERKDMFSLFDQIFLRLFPDFINQYNLLFEEEDRVEMKDDKVQLTPEIRIFALIRLGISNNESIAKFLNLSLSTIKNYKTKVKNRSNVPNELFEQKIMEIGYKN
jgi:Response regulator containing a CheY-like receiver domain and an HTH DNA-binding domain